MQLVLHLKDDNWLLSPYYQAQHTLTCIIRRENRRPAQPGQTKNYVDGEHKSRQVLEAIRKAHDRNH